MKNKYKCYWLTGLSGAGKSTIADELADKFCFTVLDGDIIRSTISKDLGFSLEDRKENLRRVAELAKELVRTNNIVCSFISPTEEVREMVKEIIGEENFRLIYIKCPIEICEERDVKGLYEKVRDGEIKNFTGIDSPFEIPKNPDLIIETDKETLIESINKIRKFINNK